MNIQQNVNNMFYVEFNRLKENTTCKNVIVAVSEYFKYFFPLS